ncbi:ABC transporter substrate-binding protein [Paenibacillus chartarius]|uniref:ABC transporter substrate-binding protein n=1 Tax=Paenibacillus chartarius TaxID=747481 RepID=A0ABV6DKB7_9BACL
MKPVARRMVSTGLVLALTVPLAVACTKAENKETEGERTLRIATTMYGGGEGENEYFRQQFTEVFEYANPNIKLEFVPVMDNSRFMYGGAPEPGEKMPDPYEKMKEVMQGSNPPDVVMVDFGQLPDLVQNNMLSPLDPMIQKDKFDTSDYVPAVLDGIKGAATDGKLYALAPTFSSSALIYNKKLFQDAGVEFPKDGMTWQEVFDLAKRVTKPDGDKPVYGFNFNTGSGGDIFWSTQMYSQPLQLRMWDDTGEHMTVDSDQWEKVWSTIIQLQKDKVMPEAIDYSQPGNRAKMMQPDQNNPFAYDDFMSGKLAMSVVYYGWLPQLINANKNAANIKGYNPIEWDVVSMPSHPEAPGVSGQIYMNGIMGINVKAHNPDDAWKFIKFINGDDWARLKSGSSGQLVSRKKHIKAPGGATFNIAAFYNTKPVAQNLNDYKIARENPNIYSVQGLAQQNFMSALQGKISVRDALKKWQTDGDAMLKQLKENPTAPIGPHGISAEQ